MQSEHITAIHINEVHYVILKSVCTIQESVEHQVQETHRGSTMTADTLTTEDAIIVHGDEVLQQITGGPLETAMCVEDPEGDLQIYSVAPGEGISQYGL